MGPEEQPAHGDEEPDVAIDQWEINRLREANEYNRANPDPQFAEIALWVQGQLTERLDQAAEVGTVNPTPIADEPAPVRRPGSGYSNYGASAATGASEAQERFIRSLCAERDVDADRLLATVKNKRDASKAIDRLKAQPRGGPVTVTQAAPAKPKVRPATERQIEFVTDLWNTRQHVVGDEVPDDMSFDDASAMIEFLLVQPKVGKVAAHGIRHGRYAYRDEAGTVHFYVVGRNGRIEVQAGPARHPYTGRSLNEALLAIKADPMSAAALYGQELGRCGRCGLELTDETSRALGLGPICAGKSEW